MPYSKYMYTVSKGSVDATTKKEKLTSDQKDGKIMVVDVIYYTFTVIVIAIYNAQNALLLRSNDT